MSVIGGRVRILALAALTTGGLSASPVFHFTLGGGITVGDPVYTGFQMAAARWSSVLTNNVTVNVTIGYKSLGSGILGQTTNTGYDVADSTLKAALASHATSANDAVAVAHLQAPGSNDFVINHTNDCGNCTAVYDSTGLKFDNTHESVTGAEAKALGLMSANNSASDGEIDFSSNFNFDFNPSDGISSNAYDFVGVATHELGHLLGFVSSVDDFDYCGALLNCVTYRPNSALAESEDDPTVLDLFRYSTNSGYGTVMDLSADTRAKYFSIDGGATLGAQFAAGVNFGDGRQASHWKDNLGLGIMDPTAAPGELLGISRNDLTAMDVIGWSLAVPEPGTAVLAVLGLAVAARRLRNRQHNIV